MGNTCCLVKKSRYTFIATNNPYSYQSTLSCHICHQFITFTTSVVVKCNNCKFIIGHANCIEPIMNEPCVLCDY